MEPGRGKNATGGGKGNSGSVAVVGRAVAVAVSARGVVGSRGTGSNEAADALSGAPGINGPT